MTDKSDERKAQLTAELTSADSQLVAGMLARSGLYVCGDSNHPTKLVPIWVDRGQAHSMCVDEPLTAHGFLPTFVIYSGPHVAPAFAPVLATAPAEPPKDGEVAALIERLRETAQRYQGLAALPTWATEPMLEAADALARLSAPVPEREWIPVGERLPDTTGDVLVSLRDGTRDIAYKDVSHGLRRRVNGFVIHDVTHWMPLPPPPAADK